MNSITVRDQLEYMGHLMGFNTSYKAGYNMAHLDK